MFFTTSTFLDPPADIHIQSKSSHKFQLTTCSERLDHIPPPDPWAPGASTGPLWRAAYAAPVAHEKRLQLRARGFVCLKSVVTSVL